LTGELSIWVPDIPENRTEGTTKEGRVGKTGMAGNGPVNGAVPQSILKSFNLGTCYSRALETIS